MNLTKRLRSLSYPKMEANQMPEKRTENFRIADHG